MQDHSVNLQVPMMPDMPEKSPNVPESTSTRQMLLIKSDTAVQTLQKQRPQENAKNNLQRGSSVIWNREDMRMIFVRMLPRHWQKKIQEMQCINSCKYLEHIISSNNFVFI